ncbi:MAG: hypothetical protein KDC69_08430, partial [Flavobacteriaceae bacterium]|nr:hypothetical protein [Flavobacteriaceae bacterium]
MLKNYRYFTLLFTFLFFQLAVAQSDKEKPSPEEIIKQKMEEVRKNISLDDLQAVYVENTLLKYYHQKDELLQRNDRTDILKAEMVELNAKQDQELLRVLNDEQLVKLK